jgi:hypothetical protein
MTVPPSGRVITGNIKDAATGNTGGVLHIIFTSVEDLKHGYGLGVKTYDSTKISTLIRSEGHQSSGVTEAGRPLALGRTIAEPNLSGKKIELSTASDVSPSAPGFDSEDEGLRDQTFLAPRLKRRHRHLSPWLI